MRNNGKNRDLDVSDVIAEYANRVGVMYQQTTMRSASMLAAVVADTGLLAQAKGTGEIDLEYHTDAESLSVIITARIRIADPRTEGKDTT